METLLFGYSVSYNEFYVVILDKNTVNGWKCYTLIMNIFKCSNKDIMMCLDLIVTYNMTFLFTLFI